MQTVRAILHIDMDAFFASIEQLDNPEYRGKPVIVGGQERGVVSTCSYEARVFGVRSAMPSSEARRRCPQGIFLMPRMRRYAEMSNLVGKAVAPFSPLIEKASVDEAYLDVTGMEHLHGSWENLAWEIQKSIEVATGGLTSSIGIAPVKFLAKIASDVNKPHGIFVLREEDVFAFVQKLPVGRIPGVGKKFEATLEKIGVHFCADVLRYPEGFWERRYGKMGQALFKRAQGLDDREVVPYTEPKSESAEHTLAKDTRDKEELKTWLFKQAERVGRSLRKHGFKGRVITLKVKYASFTQVTRQTNLPYRVNTTETIYEHAAALLDALPLTEPVRLIGLGVSGFDEKTKPQQLSLFGEQASEEKQETKRLAVDSILDALQSKHGPRALMRGRGFKPADEKKTEQSFG